MGRAHPRSHLVQPAIPGEAPHGDGRNPFVRNPTFYGSPKSPVIYYLPSVPKYTT